MVFHKALSWDLFCFYYILLIFPILFADDTNIFFDGKNIDELVQCMNCELNKVVIWLAANKLSLNIKKTHFMIFRSKRCCIDRFKNQFSSNYNY